MVTTSKGGASKDPVFFSFGVHVKRPANQAGASVDAEAAEKPRNHDPAVCDHRIEWLHFKILS